MTFINYASREINCKIVYYGPGLCGKTTNLQHIYDSTAPQAKGKLISLATETDRTLFFDFMPLELGTVRGFKTRFHLYTVPGQVYYDASRKLILKGVDGVVFVADSQEERMDANIESLYNLEDNLQTQGYDLNQLPYVLQLNKRDLPNVIPMDDLTFELQKKGEPVFEAEPVDRQITSDWETGSGMQSGAAINNTLQLDPGTGSASARLRRSSHHLGRGRPRAGHSVAVPNVIVKSGVCLGVRISSIPPGLVFAVVHGFLTKDK